MDTFNHGVRITIAEDKKNTRSILDEMQRGNDLIVRGNTDLAFKIEKLGRSTKKN